MATVNATQFVDQNGNPLFPITSSEAVGYGATTVKLKLDELGNLADLVTQNKTNHIAAINEIANSSGAVLPATLVYHGTATEPVEDGLLNADTLENHNAAYFAMRAGSVKQIPDTGVFSTLGVNADTLNNQLPAYYAKQSDLDAKIYNSNIIHNWDFRNPINQRGLTTYSTNGYCIDRWYYVGQTSGSVEILSNQGIRLNQTSGTYVLIAHRIELERWNNLIGKTLTFSIEIDGVIHSVNIIPTASGYQASEFTTSIPNLLVGWETSVSCGYLQIVLGGTGVLSSGIISRVKLELGLKSTLSNEPPMDYDKELLVCQKYYQIINTKQLGVGFAQDTTGIWMSFGYSLDMRVTPTVTLLSYPQFYPSNLVSSAILWSSLTNSGMSAVFTVSGATQYRPYVSNNNVNVFALSADL